MTDKLNNGIAALALAMDESLHQAVAANEARSPTPPASCDSYCSPVLASAPSPSTSADTSILVTLKAMETHIIAMEKNCGGGGGGGGGRKGANGRDRAECAIDPKATKCRHCSRVHIRPDSEFWDLEANAHLRPSNWKKSNKE